MIAESRAIDRVALGMLFLYGAGTALWLILTIGYTTRGRWPMAAVGLSLALLFSVQVVGWWNATRAYIRIDETSISRPGRGPCRWMVTHQEVTDVGIRQIRGVPYLVVTSSTHPKTGRCSRLLLGDLPKNAVAVPLAPAAVPQISRALARFHP